MGEVELKLGALGTLSREAQSLSRQSGVQEMRPSPPIQHACNMVAEGRGWDDYIDTAPGKLRPLK
jgi:hypothetical protein